jgi:hypothetical protein
VCNSGPLRKGRIRLQHRDRLFNTISLFQLVWVLMRVSLPHYYYYYYYYCYYYFQLRAAAFEAYCAIWVRHSNFRHQASPRVSPCESTQRRKVELWARNVREFWPNADFHATFRDLLHAVKLRHGTDGFTSPPKESVLRNFFALTFRRLRPGANPRTWVPKASTLTLDHRNRCPYHMGWVRGNFHSRDEDRLVSLEKIKTGLFVYLDEKG